MMIYGKTPSEWLACFCCKKHKKYTIAGVIIIVAILFTL